MAMGYSELKGLQSDLIRKIRQQRGVQDHLSEALQKQVISLKAANVVISAFITLVVFADFGLIAKIAPSIRSTTVMLTIGTLSLVLFIANALAEAFSIQERLATHFTTIHLLSELLRDIRKAELGPTDADKQKVVLEQFNDRYMQIMAVSPNVGASRFEKAQAAYLRHQARRLARKDKPFASWWTIRRIAEDYVGEWKSKETEL